MLHLKRHKTQIIDYAAPERSCAEKSSNPLFCDSAQRPNVAEMKQLRVGETRCKEDEEKNRAAKKKQYGDLFGRLASRMDEIRTPKRWDMNILDEPQVPAAHGRLRDTAMTREP